MCAATGPIDRFGIRHAFPRDSLLLALCNYDGLFESTPEGWHVCAVRYVLLRLDFRDSVA